MGSQKDKHRQFTQASRNRSKSPLNLTTALILILVIEIVAIGLKVFDDRQTSIESTEQIVQREALAVSEYVSGKANAVSQLLEFGMEAGWSTRRTARAEPAIDTVVQLADALSAAEGSRLRAAGETASNLRLQGLTHGLSVQGDVIVVSGMAGTTSRLAIIPADRWVPDALGGRQIELVGPSGAGQSLEATRPLSACSAVPGGSSSICVSTSRPLLGQTDWVNLAIYALLLLGPALVILGLVKMLEERSGQSEAFEGEATRAGEMLTTVLKETRAGFWSWEPESDQIWMNEEAADLIGVPSAGLYSLDQLLPRVHIDHQDMLMTALQTLPTRGLIVQTFANTRKSTWLEMRGGLKPGGDSLDGVLLDVTENRMALAQAKQAEQRLKSALEGFSGPFALWDANKRLRYWNRAFAAAFNLENVLRDGMGHETVALSQAPSILERRRSKDRNSDEMIKVTSGQWYKIVERRTTNGGMISMGLDVTDDIQNQNELNVQRAELQKLVHELERSEGHAGILAGKLNEEKLKAEESANSKSAFLANMSHELRTPLNAINGFSEILVSELYGPLGDQRYKDYAGDILASGQHLLDMINDILDMAKIEAGKMTVDLRPIDLVEPVDAAIRMIRRKAEDKRIRLTLHAREDLPRVDADHRAIRQMILNLVSNALKFTDEGGEIKVGIDLRRDMLRVAVRDNGVGIPEDALGRLAKPFEQVSDTRDRNYEGTGLGLALTKSFAEMHGGRLTISSREGVGTQVSFFIPVPEAELLKVSSASAA
ncbi:MAG: PAS domain-containing sensor histidine kinase [Pseudomonadota bacterium]